MICINAVNIRLVPFVKSGKLREKIERSDEYNNT